MSDLLIEQNEIEINHLLDSKQTLIPFLFTHESAAPAAKQALQADQADEENKQAYQAKFLIWGGKNTACRFICQQQAVCYCRHTHTERERNVRVDDARPTNGETDSCLLSEWKRNLGSCLLLHIPIFLLCFVPTKLSPVLMQNELATSKVRHERKPPSLDVQYIQTK